MSKQMFMTDFTSFCANLCTLICSSTLRFNVATSDLETTVMAAVRRSISWQRATIWVVKESFESDIYALVSSLLKTR